MFIRQGTGLQGQALFRTKLTFRPHSTESFTHRKMTLSLADRSLKTSGIKVLSQVGHDPDQNRYEKIKVCCIFFNLCYFLKNSENFLKEDSVTLTEAGHTTRSSMLGGMFYKYCSPVYKQMGQVILASIYLLDASSIHRSDI